MRRVLGLVYLLIGLVLTWILGQFAESHKGIVKDTPVTTEEYVVFFTPLVGTLMMCASFVLGLVFLLKKPNPSQPAPGEEPGAEQPREEKPPRGSSKN